MQWSKLKQRIEGNFTPPLIGRISVTSTKYRKASNEHSRGTIKVDKDVWFDACAFKWNREWYKIFNENSEIDLGERYKYADQKLMDDNVLEGYDFNKRLFDYLNTSIEDALESNDIVHKILAILDKRVGKRRIKSLQDEYCEIYDSQTFL